jgi:hypothetical protein
MNGKTGMNGEVRTSNTRAAATNVERLGAAWESPRSPWSNP